MMKTGYRVSFVLLALFFGMALLVSPGMVGGANAAPFEIGVENVLDKVECVASFLREQLQIDVPATFAEDSGIAAMVNQEATDGVITRDVPEDLTEDEKKDLAANKIIADVLASTMGGGEQVYGQNFPGELAALGYDAGEFFNILTNMNEQLPNVAYDYCWPEPFTPGFEFILDEELPGEDDNHYKRPDPVPGWLYYGRPYDLDSIVPDGVVDPRMANNGFLPFTGENVYSEETGELHDLFEDDVYLGHEGSWSCNETWPAAIAPLFFVKETRSESEVPQQGFTNSWTGEPDPGAPVTFHGEVKTDAFYQYSWDVKNVESQSPENPDTSPVTTTLYENSYAIRFAYGKDVGQYVGNYLPNSSGGEGSSSNSGLFVGLHPGGEGAFSGGWRSPYEGTYEEWESGSMVGLEGQPGEGQPRAEWDEGWVDDSTGPPTVVENRYGTGNWWDIYGDLSRESGDKIPEIMIGGDPAYLIIGEWFGDTDYYYNEDGWYRDDWGYEPSEGYFDLADSGIVFLPYPMNDEEPDDFHKYTVHFIPGDAVVHQIAENRDSDDVRGEIPLEDLLNDPKMTTPLDRALVNYQNDDVIRGKVKDGYYTPDNYEPGLQALVMDDTRDRINKDGFLAYAVQEEEDFVNKAIIDMAKAAATYDIRVNQIRDAEGFGIIRARDALFEREADAQAGRVVRDRLGNLVRSQQYILLPDANTIQVLNVSLRDGDAGKLSGLSMMDFTTTFEGTGYTGDNPKDDLPWDMWLDTQGGAQPGDLRWVETTYGTQYGPNTPELARMSVKFTNPVQESLMESRGFGGVVDGDPWPIQYIHSEALALSYRDGAGVSNQITVGFDAANNAIGGGFSIDPLGNGFEYNFEGGPIEVAFYETHNLSGGEGPSTIAGSYGGSVRDIWAALRVGNAYNGPDINDNSNLEIVIDQDQDTAFFSQPIDVVYVPMSHMAWRNYEPVVGEPPVAE